MKVAADETATIPAGVAHFQRNDTEAEIEAIEEYRPAKQMQEFFEVLIGWANEGKTNDAGMPSILRAAVMHRYFKDSIRSSSLTRNLQSLLLAPIGSPDTERRLCGISTQASQQTKQPVLRNQHKHAPFGRRTAYGSGVKRYRKVSELCHHRKIYRRLLGHFSIPGIS